MKSIKISVTLVMALLFSSLSACASEAGETQANDNRVLTVYFSATGTTEKIAEKIHNAAGGDLLRIEPMEEYTSAELDYNSDCRANREQNDPASRPAIKTELPDMANYDVVFLGYPIWWGKAPKIIYTLLESADFNGKTIIPFCTSGSSGIGGSEPDLHALVPEATWVTGRRFASNASQTTIDEWVKIVMPEPTKTSAPQADAESITYYDMQGRTANTSPKGLLIARSAQSANKILIK